jgi:hypothetical protein
MPWGRQQTFECRRSQLATTKVSGSVRLYPRTTVSPLASVRGAILQPNLEDIVTLSFTGAERRDAANWRSRLGFYEARDRGSAVQASCGMPLSIAWKRSSLSRNAPSACLRSVMSRAMFDAPTITPMLSLSGEMVTETSIFLPSFLTRTVSKGSTLSPFLIRVPMPDSSSVLSDGKSRAIDLPPPPRTYSRTLSRPSEWSLDRYIESLALCHFLIPSPAKDGFHRSHRRSLHQERTCVRSSSALRSMVRDTKKKIGMELSGVKPAL